MGQDKIYWLFRRCYRTRDEDDEEGGPRADIKPCQEVQERRDAMTPLKD